MSRGRTRHILNLSGGKDSAALAVYLKDRVPELEYVFCDTGKELPETYEYLYRLEAHLGRPIARLTNEGRGFDHYLTIYRNYLPSPQSRWCTRHLKLEPFERYVRDDRVRSYVGIRADEDRKGYIPTRRNIKPMFPFREDGVTKDDVLRILDTSGLGLPGYYTWRSRSGCYFCFFQARIEWVGLLQNHPGLFERAKQYETRDPDTGRRYTWCEGESLEELSRPQRVAQIKAEHLGQKSSFDQGGPGRPLIEVLCDVDLT